MADDAGLIQPNFVLLSFIVSNPNAMDETFEYSDHEIILYIGSTLAFHASELLTRQYRPNGKTVSRIAIDCVHKHWLENTQLPDI
jgi:hypothetical protein